MASIDYYNNNAESFYERTINRGAELKGSYDRFLKNLSPSSRLLDAGCGSGRDTKYFLNQKYEVTAFDASQHMVKYAQKETGLNVLQMIFQEMKFTQEFDGVWASASLIHIPYEDTQAIYQKIHQALKPGGIFYGSYKYGAHHRHVEGRDFYDMTEETVLPYFKGLFEVVEIWKEKDNRSKVAPSPDQQWLYFIVRKVG